MKRSARIPSLDGLRGFSILTVLLAHASSHYSSALTRNRLVHGFFASLGYFGVTVFFVISGFLITLILLKERRQTGTLSLSRFYQRRAVRILPAFLLYTGIILALGHASGLQQIYAFTFTTSYFFDHAYRPLQQLWSLSVEEQFYLIWPLLLLFGEQTASRCCWATLIISPALRVVLRHNGYLQYEHLAPAILDSIAAGCLLALYREPLSAFMRRHFTGRLPFTVLWLGTIVGAPILYHTGFVVLWGLIPCSIALVVSAAIEREDWVLNRGPLVWIGLLSYSLYLWQQPFFVLDGPMNYLWARLAMTFVAAYISYRFVEQPVLRYFRPEPMKRTPDRVRPSEQWGS